MNWRYEYKIVIKNLTLAEVKNLVLVHPAHFYERFPMRKVNNVYFDTYDLSNYHDALSGCAVRSKMRFRWYGDSIKNVIGIFELKERSGLVVSKTSQKLKKDLDLSKLTWKQIKAELEDTENKTLNLEFFYACVPILINSYDRCYFETIDGKCRITLDYNCKIFDQRLYNKPNFKFLSQAPSNIVLEIKSDKESGFDISSVTNNLPFRLMQNSKYVSGVSI